MFEFYFGITPLEIVIKLVPYVCKLVDRKSGGKFSYWPGFVDKLMLSGCYSVIGFVSHFDVVIKRAREFVPCKIMHKERYTKVI